MPDTPAKDPARQSVMKLCLLGLLTLLMYIPMFFVSDIVDERLRYSRQVLTGISSEWGGPQTIFGPVLVIPVEETVTETEQRRTVDPATGAVTWTDHEVEEVRPAAPVFIAPVDMQASVNIATQTRRRGIFETPVYTSAFDATATFSTEGADSQLGPGEDILWDQAEIHFGLSDLRGLRGEVGVSLGGRDLPVSVARDVSKAANLLSAPTDDPRGAEAFSLSFSLNGAKSFAVAPIGGDSRLSISGDWPHPSFTGGFLPDQSRVTDKGFSAEWTIPRLARALRTISRNSQMSSAGETAMGIEFLRPNDFYQKAWRTARYAVLFIALTFLCVLLVERAAGVSAHIIHYGLIGVAQCVFVLLMVAYAEQIGYGPAYLVSACATVGLITAFAWLTLGLGRRALWLCAVLAALYGVLFVILRSLDYAFLLGATLAFLAVGATMFGIGRQGLEGVSLPRLPNLRRKAP